MARDLGPKCKKCRREGEKLFLKGDRCNTQHCSVARRSYPPGQHGTARPGRVSEYGLQLREKQKIKKVYGLLEKQLYRYFTNAAKKKGATDANLIQQLEVRLDNVVYRFGLAKSRSLARQLVVHGHIYVNGRKVTIPSYRVRVGDKISVKPSASKKNYWQGVLKSINTEEVPGWVSWDKKNNAGEVTNLPTADDVDQSFDTRLIIEFYSR